MKRICTLLLLIATHFTFAQNIPEGAVFSGQARDNTGAILVNTTIKVRLSYLSDITPVAVEYQEGHNFVTTNLFGEFYVVAGEGQYITGAVQSLIDVPWSSGPIYLKIEIDLGNGWVDMGTIRLWSSYYAFASKTAASFSMSGTDGQILAYNNGQWSAVNAPQISYNSFTGDVELSNGGGSYTTPTALSGAAYSEQTVTGTQRATWIEDVNLQRTVPNAGTYIIVASGRAWGLQPGEYATFRLYNATSNTIIGQAVIGAGDNTGTFSNSFPIAANDVIKVEYRVLPASANAQTFYLSGNNEGGSSYSLIKVK